MKFSENLKYLRNQQQLTQKDLANHLGLSANCICEWEKNRSEPSISTIAELANLFDVSSDYLLGIEDDFGERFSAEHIRPIGDIAYSSEERKLIEIYRSLSSDLKETLWSLLSTWDTSVKKMQPKS